MGVRAGGDGIKTRHDLFQDADKSLRGFEGSEVFRGQIQHVPAPQEIAEGFLIPGQKRVQLLAAGGGGPLGQQGFVDIGNVIAVNQGCLLYTSGIEDGAYSTSFCSGHDIGTSLNSINFHK